MRASTLTEFLDLVAIPATGSCDGFPDDLRQNHRLFTTWLTDATEVQPDALWVLLKRSMRCGLSPPRMATMASAAVSGKRAHDAETVVAIFHFPEDKEPWIEINARTIMKSRIQAQLRQNLFGEDGYILSPAAQKFAVGLGRILDRQSTIIPRLLDDYYIHTEWRRRLAYRLPCSHPVGGLIDGSAEVTWRDAWKASPMAALAQQSRLAN